MLVMKLSLMLKDDAPVYFTYSVFHTACCTPLMKLII